MVVNKPKHPNAEIHDFIQKCFDWKYQHINIFDKKYYVTDKIIIPILGLSFAPTHMTFLPIKLANLKYKNYIFKKPELIHIDTTGLGSSEYHIQIDEIKRIN